MTAVARRNVILVTGSPGWLGTRLVEALIRGLPNDETLKEPRSDSNIRCLILPGQDPSPLRKLSPQIEIVTGDLRNEAVAFADYGPNETWLDIIIVQGDTNFADGGVDALFDVNEEILAPQLGGDLLTCQDVGVIVDQQHEQLHGKAFQPYGSALAEKLEARVIQFELVEPDLLLRHVPNLQ